MWLYSFNPHRQERAVVAAGETQGSAILNLSTALVCNYVLLLLITYIEPPPNQQNEPQ